LIRQITLCRTTNSQILVSTLTPEMFQAYKAGKTPEYIQASEQIAGHYGIPSANPAQYAAEKIIAKEISFEAFSADGVNPTDAGARIYADAILLNKGDGIALWSGESTECALAHGVLKGDGREQ
jgi:hypothetical protein